MQKPYQTWTQLEILTDTICNFARRSEGCIKATRVLVETLTPGLRYLHSILKESLNLAQQRAQAEVEVYLQKQGTELHTLNHILKDINFLEEQDWWQSILEVAECGAQRDVLTKLVYKYLGQHEDVAKLRSKWWKAFVKKDGLKIVINPLLKNKKPEEKLPITEMIKVAVTALRIPSLSQEDRLTWLGHQKKWLEAIMTRSWGDAKQQLKSMVKLAPRDSSICLYWSLIKCAEGSIEEAFKGVLRAHELDPSDLGIAKLKDEVVTWQMTLQEAKKVAFEKVKAQASAQSDLHVQTQATRSAPTIATLPLQEIHTAETDHSSQIIPQAWQLPTALLQVLLDLGPNHVTQTTHIYLLQHIYQNLKLQHVHLRNAFELYPQAYALKNCQNQLQHCLKLIENGLHAHYENAYLPSSEHQNHPVFSAIQPVGYSPASYMPGMESDLSHPIGSMDEPPPVPADFNDLQVPTGLLQAMTPMPLSREAKTNDSLSLDIDAPLDFTLEPEQNDLARAQSLIKLGKLNQAEACLLSLLDQNPFDALVHNDLGVLYFQQQRFGDAKTHLILAIETIPSYEEAWSNLVELCASLGQLHHIVPLFRRFHHLVESSTELQKLKELCDRYTPEGTDVLNPPTYDNTQGLKLPLSGSFFITPSADENIHEAISAPIDEWAIPNEDVLAERQKAQQEIAVQMRADVNTLLDEWVREGAQTSHQKPIGVLGWIKTKIGLKASNDDLVEQKIQALMMQRQQAVDEIDEVDEQEMQAQAGQEIRELPEDLHRIRNITFSMLCVPAGTFKMGTSEKSSYGCANEYPQHRVVISRSFQLSRFPVTQELYEAVTWRSPSPNKAPGHPVVRVSWFDAIRFCNTLSDLEGLPVAYQISKGARPEVAIIPNSQGYRLPTEAEWEYCARARQFFAYAGGDMISQVGWAQVDRMHAVGRKEPNAWGFHDLSGNVWEWCEDGMRDYSRQSQLDPEGERYTYMHTPSARVIRGGSWCFEQDGSRVAFRGRGAPGLRISSLGFRVARSL